MTAPRRGGVRVSHPTKRNAIEVIADPTRQLSSPQVCPTCQVKHTHKTYHILLNDEGTAIVSPGVYQGLVRGGMGDLKVENLVEKPPTQVLGARNGMMGLIPSRRRIENYHSDPED